jgi:hypothetical protein
MRAPQQSFVGAVDDYMRTCAVNTDDWHFLERLRNAIGVRPHPENVRFVERLVGAWHAASSICQIREAERHLDKDMNEVHNAVRVFHDQGFLAPGNGPHLVEHGIAFLDGRLISNVAIDTAFYLGDEPRPQETRQSTAERLFMILVSVAMRDLFGRPRYALVGHLIDVAFDKPPDETTTPEDVRNAWRRSGQLNRK